jgi:hypothetical protein
MSEEITQTVTTVDPANTPPSRGSRWPKGFSGNPAGRPKLKGEEREVMELARKYGKRAVRRLAKLMRSNNERVAVAAAQALLDRGFGKPAQAITGAGGSPLIPPHLLGLMGAPIADAMSAAAAYAAILGDATIDLSLIEFAAPAPTQALIIDNPIVDAEVIESTAAPAIDATTEDHPAQPMALPSVAPAELPDANRDRASLARLRGVLRKC